MATRSPTATATRFPPNIRPLPRWRGPSPTSSKSKPRWPAAPRASRFAALRGRHRHADANFSGPRAGGAVRPDAAVAELWHPGAVRRCARTEAQRRRARAVGVRDCLSGPGARRPAAERISGRVAAGRGPERRAQRAGGERSTQRADAERDAGLARGGAAARLPGGGVSNEIGTGAAGAAPGVSRPSQSGPPIGRFFRRADASRARDPGGGYWSG